MNIIIEVLPHQEMPRVHLYHSTANAIACMTSLAKKHGVELEEEDYGDDDRSLSQLIYEIKEGLSGSGIVIHWLDVEPVDNKKGEFK